MGEIKFPVFERCFSDPGLSRHVELLSHFSHSVFQEQLVWGQSRSCHVYRYDFLSQLFHIVLGWITVMTSQHQTVELILRFVLPGFLLGNLPEEHLSHLNMGSVTKGEGNFPKMKTPIFLCLTVCFLSPQVWWCCSRIQILWWEWRLLRPWGIFTELHTQTLSLDPNHHDQIKTRAKDAELLWETLCIYAHVLNLLKLCYCASAGI